MINEKDYDDTINWFYEFHRKIISKKRLKELYPYNEYKNKSIDDLNDDLFCTI